MNGLLVIQALAASIAAKGFQGLLEGMVQRYFSRRVQALDTSASEIKTDLGPHLEAIFDKCIQTKTILNDTPVPLLEIYVGQLFLRQGESVDQYTLIEEIKSSPRCLVITGTGGGGKSFFMKYLWLSFFEDTSHGRFPLFAELRNINNITKLNIVDYLFHSVIRTGATISQRQFLRAMSNGEIILFLDGFDEIVPDRRRDAERQIQQLREDNPKLTIIMTSRPDDRFSGWHQFAHAEVLPLPKPDTLLLIDRAIYDPHSKTRLIERIKNGRLYETHESFLSNPLLAYMMLLTIARNPDIPNRMSAFYELAFDALYHRHDTSKGGGYVRQYYTSLDKHQFIRLLSFFCLISYYDGVIEGPETKMLEFIERACQFEETDVDAVKFLGDLFENSCILRKDGLDYTFIHRSFQEYFSAVCLSRVASRDIEGLFGHFSKRYNDEVLPMVAEMDPDLFREKYLVPMRDRFKSFFDLSESAITDETYLHQCEQQFVGRIMDNPARHVSTSRKKAARRTNRLAFPEEDRIHVNVTGSSPFLQFVNSLRSVSGFGKIEDTEEWRRRSLQERRDEKFFNVYLKRYNLDEVAVYSSNGKDLLIGGMDETVLEGGDAVVEAFRRTFMHVYVDFYAHAAHRYVNLEAKKYEKVTAKFEEMFR